MNEASEYRAHAAECRALAETMDGAHREQLLRMAQTWDKLAQEHSAPASQPVNANEQSAVARIDEKRKNRRRCMGRMAKF